MFITKNKIKNSKTKKKKEKEKENAELTRRFMRITLSGLPLLADTVGCYPNSIAGTSR